MAERHPPQIAVKTRHTNPHQARCSWCESVRTPLKLWRTAEVEMLPMVSRKYRWRADAGASADSSCWAHVTEHSTTLHSQPWYNHWS